VTPSAGLRPGQGWASGLGSRVLGKSKIAGPESCGAMLVEGLEGR
jgi:hypothetical protein